MSQNELQRVVVDVIWRIDNEAAQFIDKNGMEYLKYLRGLLSIESAQAVAPGGRKLVPVEPTGDMLLAMNMRLPPQYDGGDCRDIYRELLAAAPASEAVVVDDFGPVCKRCGDTGDVHRQDGEYIGKCDCGAFSVGLKTAQQRDHDQGAVEWEHFNNGAAVEYSPLDDPIAGWHDATATIKAQGFLWDTNDYRIKLANCDCSGDPQNCPSNEGYGCDCKPAASSAVGESVPLMKCICVGEGAGCTNKCDRGQVPPLPAKTYTIPASPRVEQERAGESDDAAIREAFEKESAAAFERADPEGVWQWRPSAYEAFKLGYTATLLRRAARVEVDEAMVERALRAFSLTGHEYYSTGYCAGNRDSMRAALAAALELGK